MGAECQEDGQCVILSRHRGEAPATDTGGSSFIFSFFMSNGWQQVDTAQLK